ncbi:hypothetical protein [Amycolatopsis thermoflava]|uniref:Uncharacterized protein n=1 Tax=Amycolatopsis thermoflava TaxID=84480 RepID=A0A3N2GZ63_9PSEU|nr:hypothetical protein [Amycolatopsis thermoflava]ROS41913.1 hypothetical protein EDD35_4286 [Amycolatopsis thermoflava]
MNGAFTRRRLGLWWVDERSVHFFALGCAGGASMNSPIASPQHHWTSGEPMNGPFNHAHADGQQRRSMNGPFIAA